MRSEPPTQPENIVLIGMPGSGKSTLGVILAKTLSMPFLDTDILIQTRENRPLQSILLERGVEGFKEIEEACILSLDCRGHVIATGGSVVYSPRAMDHLSRGGWILSLDLSFPLLAERIQDMQTRGIVMDPKQNLESLFRERKPLYDRYADIRIPCDGKRHEPLIRDILERLRANRCRGG